MRNDLNITVDCVQGEMNALQANIHAVYRAGVLINSFKVVILH